MADLMLLYYVYDVLIYCIVFIVTVHTQEQVDCNSMMTHTYILCGKLKLTMLLGLH